MSVLILLLTVDFYDFGGSLQWSIPNCSRIVHVTAALRFGAKSFGLSANQYAGNFGGSMRDHIVNNFGLLSDPHDFRGSDLPRLVRTSVGFFYQFK